MLQDSDLHRIASEFHNFTENGAVEIGDEAIVYDSSLVEEPEEIEEAEPIEEVVVTGIRASLEQALDIKRGNSGVVDAIAARRSQRAASPVRRTLNGCAAAPAPSGSETTSTSSPAVRSIHGSAPTSRPGSDAWRAHSTRTSIDHC